MAQQISPQSSPAKRQEASESAMLTRRGLLMKLGIAFNGLVALALAVPIVRFALSSVTRGRSNGYISWVRLGPVSDFPEGETRLATFRNPFVTPTDGKTVDTACWVRRVAGDEFQVFAVNCAHLGCPVRWFPQSGLFMCPCHGGAYYRDGSRASGPPERGLFEYPYKVADGVVSIRAGELPTPGGSAANLPRKEPGSELVTIAGGRALAAKPSAFTDCAALQDCSALLGKKPPCA
jgi:Rieske Fe-S protein